MLRLALFLSLPLALAVLVVIRRASGYQGKPAIVWFEEMAMPREPEGPGPEPAGLEALRKIGKRALPTLERALETGPRWERTKAAWTLGRLGPVATNAIPSLVQAVDDTDPIVRYYAIRSLTRLDAAGDDLIPKLVARLGDPERVVCPAAAELLSNIEQQREARHLPPVWANEFDHAMAFVRSPHVRLRLMGIDRLVSLPQRDERVVAALQSLLTDELEVVRRRAAMALNTPVGMGTNGMNPRAGVLPFHP